MTDVSDVFWPFVNMMAVDKCEYEDVFRSPVYEAFCDACDEENGLFLSKACLEPLAFDPFEVLSAHWRYDAGRDGFLASNATMLFEMVIRLYDRHEYEQESTTDPSRSSIVRACRDRMRSYVTTSDVADMMANVFV